MEEESFVGFLCAFRENGNKKRHAMVLCLGWVNDVCSFSCFVSCFLCLHIRAVVQLATMENCILDPEPFRKLKC